MRTSSMVALAIEVFLIERLGGTFSADFQLSRTPRSPKEKHEIRRTVDRISRFLMVFS